MNAENVRKRAAILNEHNDVPIVRKRKGLRWEEYTKSEILKFIKVKFKGNINYNEAIVVDDYTDEIGLKVHTFYTEVAKNGKLEFPLSYGRVYDDEFKFSITKTELPIVLDLCIPRTSVFVTSLINVDNINLAEENNITEESYKSINLYTSIDAYLMGSISWFGGAVDMVLGSKEEALNKLYKFMYISSYNMVDVGCSMLVDSVDCKEISRRGVRC